MITISDDQIKELAIIPKQNFFKSSRKLLKDTFPEKFEKSTESELNGYIHTAIERSDDLSLFKESSIQTVLYLMIQFNSNMTDLSENEINIVASANLPEKDRLQFLTKLLKK